MLRYKQKNSVLLIITDQQRYDAIGYINPSILTPNLNKLAQSGIICSKAYVQSPQCQPNRASLMTGRYPTAHRVWWNSINLPLHEKTLGNFLKSAGYRTSYFGKAHLNNNDSTVMANFGFDNSFLYEDWLRLPFNRGGDSPRAEYQSIMGSPHWTGRLTNKEYHHEEVITNRAINWLSNQHEPTFTVISYVGPHPPYAAPKPFSDLYSKNDMTVPTGRSFNMFGDELSSSQWRDLKTQYYGMVSWIDENIGRLLQHIDLDHTLIIFTSDHGDILGDHNMFSKGLFAYEGNTRVPLIIKHPDHGHIKYDHLVQTIDLAPTILAASGVPIPHSIQGKSLWPGIKENKQVNEFVLSMIGYEDRIRMIRSGNFKYWLSKDYEYLFDLENDPHELKNLVIHGERDLLHSMREKMLRALIATEDPLPMPT